MLIVNPRSDEEFLAFAHRELATGADTAASFEVALRARYPRVKVRERGLATEPATWYVYREGRWIPSETPSAT